MDLLLSQRVLWVNVSHQLRGQLKALEDTHDGEDIVKIEEDLKMRTFSNISMACPEAQDGHPAQRICRVSHESLTVKEPEPRRTDVDAHLRIMKSLQHLMYSICIILGII